MGYIIDRMKTSKAKRGYKLLENDGIPGWLSIPKTGGGRHLFICKSDVRA